MNQSVDSWNSETMDISDKIQNDCHALVEKLMSDDSRVSYTDATFVFLFNKIAELELRLRNIENNKP